MSELAPHHHAFIQTFIGRRIIAQSTLDKLVQAINQHYRLERTTIQDYLNQVVPSLDYLHMTIKNIRIENASFWCLINLKPDESSKLATHYNANETTFFKSLIENLLANAGELKISVCLDQAKNSHLTLHQAETAIQTFIDDKWFKKLTPSTITLSERALLDLNPILGDLPSCHLCHQKVLAVNGKVHECQNDECSIKLHPHCLQRWNDKHCPKCKQLFEA
eukprot:gene6076-7569_t